MEEMFKKNQERMRNKRQEQLKRLKREERKDNLLGFLIGTFVLFITIFMLLSLNDKAMNNCTNAGHSKQYCERGL